MNQYVIVGASSGIGFELAKQLTESGHQVHAMSRSEKDLGQLSNLNYYEVDITAENPVFPKLESIHGLIYCPGTINLRPFRSLKPQSFQHDFEVNVLGAIKSIQAYLPQLKKATEASIVLFSTVAVQTGMSFHSSISASKGAIEGLTRSLAAELAPNHIRVNAIAPSLTDTPLAERLLSSEARAQASAERHPLKRVGKASEMASTAKFLLSSDSSWMTGQILQVDGGISAIR